MYALEKRRKEKKIKDSLTKHDLVKSSQLSCFSHLKRAVRKTNVITRLHQKLKNKFLNNFIPYQYKSVTKHYAKEWSLKIRKPIPQAEERLMLPISLMGNHNRVTIIE